MEEVCMDERLGFSHPLEPRFTIEDCRLHNTLRIEYGGERGDGVAYLNPHIDRFFMFGMFCYGRSVLDVGCGYGYGAKIMGEKAREVVGIDTDGELIKFAREKHVTGNVSFECIDLFRYARRDFDVAVCSEVVEHIGVGEVESFMCEIGMHVKRGGLVIFTTPSQEVTCKTTNECHVIEYSLFDFVGMCKKFYHVWGAMFYMWCGNPKCLFTMRPCGISTEDRKQSGVSQCIFCEVI